MFCEDVWHHLQFFLDHLNCVKIQAFQFYLQSGNKEKSQGPSHIVFGEKYPNEKEV
jgi:hypothetical protein